MKVGRSTGPTRNDGRQRQATPMNTAGSRCTQPRIPFCGKPCSKLTGLGGQVKTARAHVELLMGILTAFFLLILSQSRAFAGNAPDNWSSSRLSVGGGIGSSRGDGSLSASLEATLALRQTFGPFLSAGISQGAVAEGARYVYGEVAFWAYLSFGVGGGYRFNVNSPGGLDASGVAWHLFVGLPVPVVGAPGRGSLFVRGYSHGGLAPALLYVEPYYRPQFSPGAPGWTVHEIGVLIKVTLDLAPGHWRRSERQF
jgi:hypothetical protein